VTIAGTEYNHSNQIGSAKPTTYPLTMNRSREAIKFFQGDKGKAAQVSITNMDALELGERMATKPAMNNSFYGATNGTESVTEPMCSGSCVCSEDDSFNGRRNSVVDSIFSDVRSVDNYEALEEMNESELNHKSSSLQRAMPERLVALAITLLLEIPVLMMVPGGSDALCGLIGRSRYQLLIGFLPLSSAISGNVGLQASTLTTRAISHSQVTVTNYGLWLSTEIGAAVYLGLGMRAMLGSIAFVASGCDPAFGLTISVAQILSIVTAGLTGTIAPLLFSFIFKRDSGKWGGPLETAIQDIVGSFAMVIVSYHVLLLLGPGPIDPTDVCFATSSS
jgi:Divalent cation transporter